MGGGPQLPEIHQEYLRAIERRFSEATIYRYAIVLDVWEGWLRDTQGDALPPSLLSRRTIEEHAAWLSQTGMHGRPRSPATVNKHLSIIQSMWRWAADDQVYEEHVPRPRKVHTQRPASTPAIAPTWAEMDRAIMECTGPQRSLAILLRFTGLRVQQAMGLRWSDLDPKRGLLTIRGELGKSAAERAGRIVPLSNHLLEEIQTWEREGEYILPTNRHKGPRERKARARDMKAAWDRSGVRPEVWKQRPHHAFRKGFTSELKRAGADSEAVEYLVGHSRGIRGHYVDPEALPMVEAVGLIPPISTPSQGES